MGASKLHRTRNDLPADVRENIVRLLNQQLADSFDLYSQTKHAHWNVKGPQFHALHELFDAIADAVEDWIDTIAERATALGGTAYGTLRLAAAASRLREYDLGAIDSRDHLDALAARVAELARTSRAAIDEAARLGDADTADLFTEASRGLDKQLWLLEAHLQA